MSVEEPTPEAPTSEAPTSEVGSEHRRTRRVRRGPILFVVVVALVAAVVAQQDASDGSGGSSSARAVLAANASVGVPPADVASSAWYCAAGTSSRGTSSVTEAWKAGWRIAEPMPSVNVMVSSSHGDIQPSPSHSASASAAAITMSWPTIWASRRSITSASTPPSSENTNTGSDAADWTIATRSGEVAIRVMSHAAATDWIHTPRLENSVPTQIAR